jgi:hypothetical protein
MLPRAPHNTNSTHEKRQSIISRIKKSEVMGFNDIAKFISTTENTGAGIA